MGFGYITDPDVGVGDRFYVFPTLLLILLISRPIFGGFAYLLRLGRNSMKTGGIEKDDVFENTIDSPADLDRTARLTEIWETRKDEIKESEDGGSPGDEAPPGERNVE